ncbi:MAG: SUMF1/EgtB/PvdO family nonheme iron enzyme [Planctomycetes bacterium]|nr:SUMF1/EgtB/PvdO family nonheme iron enzyme [Planctomycetota bacterium]
MVEPPDLPALPDDLLDRLFRTLYGPADQRDHDLAALYAAEPQHAEAMRSHAEWSTTMQEATHLEPGESGPARWLRRWSLAPGTTFGPYRIVEALGSGGMGTVFAARRLADDALLALKVLHPGVLRHPEAKRRFAREAQVLERLRHPGICEQVDFGELEGCPFLVMRLVNGPTLAERITFARRLGKTTGFDDALLPDTTRSRSPTGHGVGRHLAATLHLLEQLAAALQVAHEHGVVHRDVKPGNIMLDADGRPVLVDFGLATHGAHTTLTATGDLLGTPAYMAPEQVRRGADEPDAQADVYSLGAVLFECLTLRAPFVANSHGALLAAIARTAPPALRDLRPDLPKDLETVVSTALARDRRVRYRTAQELAADLARVRRGEPVVARRLSWLAHGRDFASRNRTFTTITALAAAATTLLVLLAAIVRAEQHEADLLSSTAIVAMAHAAEAQLWPVTPDQPAKLAAWLQRFAAPGDPGSLPARLQRLEAACGCSAEAALRHERSRLFADERRRLQQELLAISRLTAVDGDGSMPTGEFEQFKLRRAEWLRVELRRVAEVPPAATAGSPAHLAALLATARYVVDGAEVPDRPGAIHRVEQALQRQRSPANAATPVSWQAVQQAVGAARPPYRRPLQLAPQRGLAPLGPDPETGLQEFVVMHTGLAPTRDAEGRLQRAPDAAIVLVLLPGGDATIGTSHIDFGADALAFPAHRLRLDPFFLAKHEVTQHQWRTMGGGTPSRLTAGDEFFGERIGEAHPVENVDREACREVLGWHGLTLPTEAQWEYAARGGLGAPRLSELARERGRDNTAADWNRPMPPFVSDDGWDGHLLATATGSFPANGFGLHDIGGNVSEWCDDRFGPYCFPTRPGDGRRLTTWGAHAVARGANFMINTRLHHRMPVPASLRLPVLGVRAARRLDG